MRQTFELLSWNQVISLLGAYSVFTGCNCTSGLGVLPEVVLKNVVFSKARVFVYLGRSVRVSTSALTLSKVSLDVDRLISLK